MPNKVAGKTSTRPGVLFSEVNILTRGIAESRKRRDVAGIKVEGGAVNVGAIVRNVDGLFCVVAIMIVGDDLAIESGASELGANKAIDQTEFILFSKRHTRFVTSVQGFILWGHGPNVNALRLHGVHIV